MIKHLVDLLDKLLLYTYYYLFIVIFIIFLNYYDQRSYINYVAYQI